MSRQFAYPRLMTALACTRFECDGSLLVAEGPHRRVRILVQDS